MDEVFKNTGGDESGGSGDGELPAVARRIVNGDQRKIVRESAAKE